MSGKIADLISDAAKHIEGDSALDKAARIIIVEIIEAAADAIRNRRKTTAQIVSELRNIDPKLNMPWTRDGDGK